MQPQLSASQPSPANITVLSGERLQLYSKLANGTFTFEGTNSGVGEVVDRIGEHCTYHAQHVSAWAVFRGQGAPSSTVPSKLLGHTPPYPACVALGKREDPANLQARAGWGMHASLAHALGHGSAPCPVVWSPNALLAPYATTGGLSCLHRARSNPRAAKPGSVVAQIARESGFCCCS